jgi:hypothetical protein
MCPWWLSRQGIVTVQVLANSFTDLSDLYNPDPSEQFTFIYDSILPVVTSFTVNRTITPYLDKPQLQATLFTVSFGEVSVVVVILSSSPSSVLSLSSSPPILSYVSPLALHSSASCITADVAACRCVCRRQRPYTLFTEANVEVVNGRARNMTWDVYKRIYYFFIEPFTDDLVRIRIPPVRHVLPLSVRW